MTEAIVAGHICLDVIPSLPHQESELSFLPGSLMIVGAAIVSTGGAVSNTGLALHRLGAATRLVAKVGDDPFGRVVREVLTRVDPALAKGLLTAAGHHTSYTIILSPPDQDRMFLHFPGANDTFGSEDVPDEHLKGARLFHFGYPPVMRRMYENDGADLARLFGRAKSFGLTTALDMCYPDPDAPSGRSDWQRFLQVVLPTVDVFLPSLPEMLVMLESESARALLKDDPAALEWVPVHEISSLAERFISLGAGVVGIKAGERGIYLGTASTVRLHDAGQAIPTDITAWADRELWSTSFQTHVEGTTGAGDAAVAGFLFGLLRGMSPEETLIAACAAGASCVEAVDATSGIQSWPALRGRIQGGWQQDDASPGDMWVPSGRQGISIGPSDRTYASPRA